MEKQNVKRNVAMNIKADANSTPIRINVEFDLSELTPEQITDWAVSANGIRVWYQNRERPKGNTHLLELAKRVQTVKVPPCGTRMAATLSNNDMMGLILKRKFASDEEYMEFVEMYDSIEEALTAKLMEQTR